MDILFDDGLHNILTSGARYPILMRRPWNQEATGMLAVNDYESFLKVVEVIANSYKVPTDPASDDHRIVVLVGPSGSGKSKIATRFLEQNNQYEKLVSYTTKDPTAVQENKWYNYVSVETFRKMCECGELVESTMYAGHGYGSRKADVESILGQGKRVLTTMDICGAMALKTHFDNVVSIYIKRDKKALMANILRKNSSIEDKVNRLSAIEYEEQNAELCDYVVRFDTYDDAVRQLNEILLPETEK
jgi:guanylate kinase